MVLSLENCTFLFEAGEDIVSLLGKIERFREDLPTVSYRMVALKEDLHEKGELGKLPDLLVVDHWADLAVHTQTPFFAFLPASMSYSTPVFSDNSLDRSTLIPWGPLLNLSADNGVRMSTPDVGWVGSVELLKKIPAKARLNGFRSVTDLYQDSKVPLKALSCPAGRSTWSPVQRALKPSKLNKTCSVMALVPHRDCNEFLEQALRSLVEQTRPLEAIVVIDDQSLVLPTDIVQKFPQVTLLKSPGCVGPYALIQAVIDSTHHDAYLFQDADDWCSIDRLEMLLNKAEETGAELLGTQELMFFGDSLNINRYPLDVNNALSQGARYALVHPSSLVSRSLVDRLGGYASGLKFSGDLEFLTRAVHQATVINVDFYAYFRRMRRGSLTLSAETGLISAARKQVDERTRQRMQENLQKISEGKSPDLSPLEKIQPVPLEWVCGPRL